MCVEVAGEDLRDGNEGLSWRGGKKGLHFRSL